jgi:hypothetical protein
MNKHLLAIAIGLGLLGCNSSSSTPSTPTATPTPVPVPTQQPTPIPDNLQQETYCVPAPPALHNIRVKVHQDFGYKKILDSRALVGPDAGYCSAIGYPGNICVVRNEGDPQAVTCNNLAMGKATDTGRFGPTWSWEGRPCRPAGDGGNDPGCRNHETNQFLVYAFGPGTYAACGSNGACNAIAIP